MAASKPLPVAAQCALAGACGLAFGVAFDKSRVFQPDVIVDQARRNARATLRASSAPHADGAWLALRFPRAQMLMERFIMLKMFMGAVGTSAASLGLISVVAPEKFAAARAKACVPCASPCAAADARLALAQVSGGKKQLKVAALGAGACGLSGDARLQT